MYSDLPKVLHTIGGKPLLTHVIDVARELAPKAIHVVYGHGGEMVPEVINQADLNWVMQDQQLGTGHAVEQAMPQVDDGSRVLVLYGDVPLTRASSLQALVDVAGDGIAVMTALLDDASGYGRIVRDSGNNVVAIVEHKDLTSEQLNIREINSGYITAPARLLRQRLKQLGNNNAAGEYYLTDIIAMSVADKVTVKGYIASNNNEILGVNNKQQLAYLERALQTRIANDLMMQGVSLRDPARIDVRGEFHVGRDVEIDINVVIEGKVVLGDRVSIGPNCVLKDVSIGNDTRVFANSVMEQAEIGNVCRIGPFARLRPEAAIADNAHIGNFVEIKKSSIGEGSKVNHLSYIGDTQMGDGVNIGAGTITCNYDGVNKHQTIIGHGAFVGSASQLVAPVKIGDHATIGAGSTITVDTPESQLTLTRVKQKSISGWKRPTKNSQARNKK